MTLGLSQLGSQISSIQDQNHPSTDLLRLGSAGGAQFDHLISHSNQSSFRLPHSTPSSSFFLPSSNQGYNEEPQPHHSLLQSKPFHGLMQLPDLQGNNNTHNSSSVNLLNLSFFTNSSSTSSINSNNNPNNNNNCNSNPPSSGGVLIPDQFSNLVSAQMGSGSCSLYNPSFQNDSVLPQMSATALLQKAAQMGATTSSNNISLLRGFGSLSSNNVKEDRPQHLLTNFKGGGFSSGSEESLRLEVEDETHLQNLIMSSLPSGGFGALERNLCNMRGSDGLTRDFLGVGGMVRGMSRTASQREQHQGIGSLDPGMNAGDVNRCLGGENLQ